MIKIKKGVPIPKYRRGSVYPFAEMEVGDMFEFPFNRTQQMSIYSAARNFTKHNEINWKFFVTANKEGNYIKCWRVK